MFSNRNWIAIALAVILGIAAVIIANAYLTGTDEQNKAAAEDNRLVQIAVARVPMIYGTALSSENIKMVAWPQTSLPAGAFQSTKGLFGGTETRVALRPIEAGEPILPGKITGPGGRASISALIDPLLRAVAVRINDVAGVAGFVLPGDSVDVFITRTPPDVDGKSDKEITDILLQNVQVVAIDQNANEADNKPNVGKTVTLAVDQVGAQKLALAGQVGTLSLALRNASNQDEFPATTVGLADLGPGSYNRSYEKSSAAPAPAFADPFGGIFSRIASSRGNAAPAPAAIVKRRDPNAATMQIVRGTNSTEYEVKRYGR